MEDARSDLPLAGVRVISLCQFGAGPFATMQLADLGAEVIKIEDPAQGGDVGRYVPPFTGDRDSFYFQSFNRNKRSVTLNLRVPAARNVLHRLVAVSDAIYYNLRGDLPKKLGLTYEALGRVNPKIVCCSLSAFGQTGPRAAEPGYDLLMQGYAGFMSLTGEPGTPPAKCGISIVDFAGAYVSAIGLLSAVIRARATGRGGDVDVSLLDTLIAMLSYLAINTLNREYEPERLSASAHPSLYPSQVFETADGYVAIICFKEKFWRELCDVFGRSELAEDPRFRSFADRLAHRAELLPLVAEVFRTRTTAAWLDALRGRVPCAPVNTVRQALEEPQVHARSMLVEVEHPVWGTLRETGNPIKTGADERRPRPAPPLGEDTDAVISELLGYDAAEIGALRAAGAI
ncbi:MAG: CoA transferase [Chloroflexota bacterium]|nr:CoA transferase [Chloroflexota bacterium]